MHIPRNPKVAQALFQLLRRFEHELSEAPVPSTDDGPGPGFELVRWIFPRHHLVVWTGLGVEPGGIHIEKPSSAGGWFAFCVWTPVQQFEFARESLERLLEDAKYFKP